MAEKIKIQSTHIEEAYMTYLFPFSFRKKERGKLIEQLEKNHFQFFKLSKSELQNAYYGEGVCINHKELEQFFLPFAEAKLFPSSVKDRGFLRYSKEIKESFSFKENNDLIHFIVNSFDILLCPFEIGIITVRVEMDKTHETLTNILNFMNHFRVLEPKLKEQMGGKIVQDDQTFDTTSALILDYFCHFLKPFIIPNKRLEGYYGSLPFFEDERMFSTAFFIAANDQTITNDQLFRMAQLDGKDLEGQAVISSTNALYIERYIKDRILDRWAPNTYTITSEHTQMSISIKKRHHLNKEVSQFMSTQYYNLVLHYYYKITLLLLSFEHSEVGWTKDKEYVEAIIELISKFDSRYYFEEVSVNTEGKELTHILRETFQISNLFEEVKRTVNDLYRTQEKQTDKRHNMLLFMLTIYTVISGIYGMNLVIEDWDGEGNWSEVFGYSFLEWISLITAVTGIALSVILLVTTGGKGVWSKYRRWKRERLK